MATNTPTLTLSAGEVDSVAATGVMRYVAGAKGVEPQSYWYGFGATEPTVWSKHDITINDGFNAPDEMGKMWFWNQSDKELTINVHLGA